MGRAGIIPDVTASRPGEELEGAHSQPAMTSTATMFRDKCYINTQAFTRPCHPDKAQRVQGLVSMG